jgi:SSS family solute:Na+ symporter
LAIAAMLSVILSSSNSFINSTSIAVCEDVLPGKIMQNKLLSFRIATMIIITIATAFALGSRSALDILLYSYQFWTPIILVPLIMVIYGFRGSHSVFIYASLFSGLIVVLWQLYSPFQVKLDGALEGVIVGVFSNIVFYIAAYQMNYLKKTS